MKTYSDIHTYYPSETILHKDLYSDFAIIRIEDVSKYLKGEYFEMLAKPHLRDFYEIAIGIDEPSAASVSIGANQFKNRDMNVVFISPVQRFAIEFDSTKDVELDRGFIIAFKPSILLSKKSSFEIQNTFRYFNSYTLPQYVLDKNEFHEILEITKMISKEYENTTKHSREIISCYVEALLYRFNQYLKLNEEFVASNSCEYIAANFEHRIVQDGNEIKNITDYAADLNISTNYLSECVKRATGKSAKQILMSHKLIVAKYLLSKKEKTISEVSYELQFSEPTNFTKFFKQMTGMTPNQFRTGLEK